MMNPGQYFPVSLSALGAVIAACFVLILRALPRPQAPGMQRIWLAAWASMCAHFLLQALQRAGWHAAATGDLSLLMLVASLVAFSDWLVREAWPGGQWLLRTAGVAAVGWFLFFPLAWPNLQGLWAGLLLAAGALAALRLRWRSALSRRLLTFSLGAWAAAMAVPPGWLPGSAAFQYNFLDAFTLLSKTFCGLAMIVVVMDEQRHYLHDLFENSPLWYHTFDPQGVITDINSEGLLWLEREKPEVVGHRLRDFCTEDTLTRYPDVRSALNSLQQGRLLQAVEIEILGRSGKRRTLLGQTRGHYNPRGDFLGGRTMLIDLSRERELQRELLEAQKMQAIGALSAGVAHDLNNSLTVILGQIDYLRASSELNPQLEDRLEPIARSAHEAAAFVESLLCIARPGKVKLTRLDPQALLESAAAQLKTELDGSISLTVEHTPATPPILGDERQLRQALLKLALFACQTMPQGGALSFRARPGERADEAVIELRDTGNGIAPEHLPRIFEPFFNPGPSGPGAGLGLGLAAVSAIMQAHNGRIEVESRQGEGSLFRLAFRPAAEISSSAPASA